MRELLILNNEIVEVVSQVIRAGRASMAVKHTEETYLRPLDVKVLLVFRLQNIQNYGHTILVVVSNYTLVSIRCIRLNDTILFSTGLSRLMVL